VNTDIKPGSAEATKREALQRAGVEPFTSEHVVLFGGPESLVRFAHTLACAVDPPAERLICHPEDYRAAGLQGFGPEISIALTHIPRGLAAMLKDGPERRKAALRPVEGCPRGEVWVDLSDPGRRKREGL
jgi:hypothetical protein